MASVTEPLTMDQSSKEETEKAFDFTLLGLGPDPSRFSFHFATGGGNCIFLALFGISGPDIIKNED